jgi:hypothetical protein
MGYLRASKCFSVPRGTQESYVKDISLSSEELLNVYVGKSAVLPNEFQNKRVKCCMIMDQRYYGLRSRI